MEEKVEECGEFMREKIWTYHNIAFNFVSVVLKFPFKLRISLYLTNQEEQWTMLSWSIDSRIVSMRWIAFIEWVKNSRHSIAKEINWINQFIVHFALLNKLMMHCGLLWMWLMMRERRIMRSKGIDERKLNKGNTEKSIERTD